VHVLADVTGGQIRRLLGRPTLIRDCHAELASEEQAALIGAKISRLCSELGTPATWLTEPAILEIQTIPRSSTTSLS